MLFVQDDIFEQEKIDITIEKTNQSSFKPIVLVNVDAEVYMLQPNLFPNARNSN